MVVKDGKSGFIDKTGREIIPFIYTMTCLFSFDTFHNGLACVIKDHQCCLIDKTGQEVISCIYDDILVLGDTISDIYDQFIYYKGYVKVKKDGKWGLLDDEDNEILKPVFYDEIEVIKILSDDYVKINLDGRETIVNKNGKIIS